MPEARIRSFSVPAPGGEYFCIINGERVSDRLWMRLRPRVIELMKKHGVSGSPEGLTAESMCKYMPDWFCSGVSGYHVVRMQEAKDNARPLFSRHVVTFDEISRRLQICTSCPKHDRSLCLTCTGALNWIQSSFGGRRVSVPEDKLSGTCECARTFSAVAAAVDYDETDKPWDGAPKTCWRHSHE